MYVTKLSSQLLVTLTCFTLGACQIADMVGSKKTTASNPAPANGQTANSAPSAAPSSPAPTPTNNNLVPAKSTRSDGRVFASPEEFDAYQALVKEHPVLELLYNLNEDRIHLSITPSEAAAAIRKLAPQLTAVGNFASQCDAYRDLVVMNLRSWQEPRVACDTAKLGKTAAKKMATLAAHRYVKKQAKKIRVNIKGLGNGYTPSAQLLNTFLSADPESERRRVTEALAPLLAISGSEMDISREIPNIGKIREEALAKGLETTRGYIFPAKANASIKKAVKQTFSKRTPSPKISKVLAKKTDWTIRKKSSGIPSYRWHSVQIVAKVKGDSYCRLYDMEARQSYAGGGRWQKSVEINVTNGFRILKCK